jgi:ketosteroid isomerase-like protein
MGIFPSPYFDVPIVHIWTMREGQVIRFELYIDNATMLAALQG